MATKSDILTYEIELGDSEFLKSIKTSQINPSPTTLGIIQDKLTQKKFLQENDLPVGDFVKIESLENLKEKLKKIGYPALLKARTDSYDGRGNYKIDTEDQVEKAYEQFNGREMMLEKFIDFKMEVSVIAARNTKGDIATYPLVENIHRENILHMTIVPARVTSEVSKKAEVIAKKTLTVLKGAGVFGIEMFLTQNNELLINEIAPRVHNSGHHTLQSSKTSQFEQHIRAILGLELGSTELIHNTIMCNILGPKNFTGKYNLVQKQTDENVYVKMYNKEESKPQRKMGHFNLVDETDDGDIEELIKRAQKIQDSISLEPI